MPDSITEKGLKLISYVKMTFFFVFVWFLKQNILFCYLVGKLLLTEHYRTV